MLSQLFDWRDALVVVQPKTIIRWQRAGWRLFWRWKCRPGRPRISLELRALIRKMAQENPIWGEERIANELLVKLGIRVSPSTIHKYMPKLPAGQPRGDQRWSTFLKNSVVGPRATIRRPVAKHPVRAQEDRSRDLASEHPSVLQVHDELDVGRLCDGEVPTFDALEEFGHGKMSADELTRQSI